MAIAFDAKATKVDDGYDGGGSNWTWTHVCTGSNLLLVVEVALWQDAAGTGSISGITYNSVALTKANTELSVGMESEIWYLVAPSTGSHSITATVTGATDSRRFASTSFIGVLQISPLDTTAINSTSSGAPSKAITTSAVNELIVDSVSRFSDDPLTVGGSQTQIYNDDTIPNGNSWVTSLGTASYEIVTTATSYTISWTGASVNDCAQVIACFKPAAASTVNQGAALLTMMGA